MGVAPLTQVQLRHRQLGTTSVTSVGRPSHLEPALVLPDERGHLLLPRLHDQDVACAAAAAAQGHDSPTQRQQAQELPPRAAACMPGMKVSVSMPTRQRTSQLQVVSCHLTGTSALHRDGGARVVMMHLMNSRLTTMAWSRHRMAGGDEAGCASSRRRSRICAPIPCTSATRRAG